MGIFRAVLSTQISVIDCAVRDVQSCRLRCLFWTRTRVVLIPNYASLQSSCSMQSTTSRHPPLIWTDATIMFPTASPNWELLPHWHLCAKFWIDPRTVPFRSSPSDQRFEAASSHMWAQWTQLQACCTCWSLRRSCYAPSALWSKCSDPGAQIQVRMCSCFWVMFHAFMWCYMPGLRFWISTFDLVREPPTLQ